MDHFTETKKFQTLIHQVTAIVKIDYFEKIENE